MSLKNISIDDGVLRYTERDSSSGKEGHLLITRIKGQVENVKNKDFVETDSLSCSLKGFLMDSALIKLAIQQSYSDPRSTFLINLQVTPTPLSILNPMVTPLSNLMITSGTINSLNLHAVASEYVAFGEMKMYYHNLRVRLLKDGAHEKRTLCNRALNFLLNTFLIKKNNTSRTGLVYFKRLRDKSFFNYILKMTLSGMTSSIGLKSNRKYRKEYERYMKESTLNGK